MSKYTTNFRHLIEGGFVSRNDIENIFKSYDLSDYLTQDEIDVITERGTWTKDKLAVKIVDHYYLKDLGFETYSMFKHYALIQMKEIMESKLPLIYSASIKYDPLINVNYKEEFSRTIDNTGSDSSTTNATNNTTQNSTGSATNSGSGLTVNSDTPQGQISKETILGGSYASSTSAIENTSTASTTDSTTNNNTINSSINNSNTNNMQEGSTKTIKGNSGVSATSQKMILQYRENIRAIDKEIIEELNDLFMGLF